MPGEIRESDWKIFRDLREVALERFCQRQLADIQKLITDESQPCYDRFTKAFKLIREQRKELERGFDSVRRLTALDQLTYCRRYGLVTDDEMARFSDEARQTVESWLRL